MAPLKLNIDSQNAAVASLLVLENFKSASKFSCDIKYKNVNSIEIDSNTTLEGDASMCRYLVRSNSSPLYGSSLLEATEIDFWIDFAQTQFSDASFDKDVYHLDKVLGPITYLVGHQLTLADIFIWKQLHFSKRWQQMTQKANVPQNTLRFYNFLTSQEAFQSVLSNPSLKLDTLKEGRKEEGKFVDLPNAKKGEVVVRFPPEASGYLHVGHAKAALLNQYYQKLFEGRLILRFDDTNPAKESDVFEQVILKDVELLGIKYDVLSYTSDHFDVLLDLCLKLIKEGHAYVDDTNPDVMKQEREEKKESARRNQSTAENLKMWEEMKSGTEFGTKCCVRAKIDMNSANGCMRDPTLYRCKPEIHIRTGDKYKVYPTYDFACPIVDSIEGVTHALRTTEYHDRDEQYFWILKKLGLREPYLYEYSRLNLQNTVLSKRKLTWFVNEKHVDGWDDPRFPTVRGILRRGMTIEGLKQFIIAQGSSKSIVMMEWDKIWAINKKVIDPIVPRYTALTKDGAVSVTVKDATPSSKEVAKHPKNDSVGTKLVCYGPNIIIEKEDAESLKEGEIATFINWGNLKIESIKKNAAGAVSNIVASLDLENTDYKKTQKLTWLLDSEECHLVPTVAVTFDHIISKPLLGKDEDFKQFVNYNSKKEELLLGDAALATLKKGDIIQIQRKGFYICDQPYEPLSRFSGLESPCVLFYIPDGHQKEKSKSGVCDKQEQPRQEISAKEKAQSKKGKSAEKSPQEEFPQVFSKEALDVDAQIQQQGAIVRKLKENKAAKSEIDAAVKILLGYKSQFKAVSGFDWKPGCTKSFEGKGDAAQPSSNPVSNQNASDLNKRIQDQGNKVRQLKSCKAPKEEITAQVNILLSLKAEYKTLTGTEWKAEVSPVNGDKDKPAATITDPAVAEINQKITEQGNKVRQLKTDKAPKEQVDAEVKILLSLKADYKSKSGQDWKPPKETKEKQSAPKKEKESAPKKEKATVNKSNEEHSGKEMKKITRLGLEAKKEESLSDWYSQVITKAELIEYYDVSGCYILRPWAYSIWEAIHDFFDKEIKKLGVENAYFPLFVSAQALQTEKTHIGDFAPEVAWVTKSGQSELVEPVAIRPTSETVMYPSYRKWVKSHRDLPIRINQWCNVVRWEFKHPQPFLRTREFLWQEGHSAFATIEEAQEEVMTILGLYSRVYTDLLAIPVIAGKKTEKEKFAGGDYTTTVECYISASGRAIQGATSHHLGQNFSKMFEIQFEHPETQEKQYVYQNSWGLTTRTIGVMCMVHGDNIGLVLPPRVASVQVVIVPCGITATLDAESRSKLLKMCENINATLRQNDIRSKADIRDNYSPGWKFNHWELKGVPIRIEIGPRDMKQNQFVAVRRDTGEKVEMANDNISKKIQELLNKIQDNLYANAKKERDEHLCISYNWNDFCNSLDQKKLIQSPFCGGVSCEDKIKKDSARDVVVEEGAPAMGAKGLCIPFQQPAELKPGTLCIHPDCKKNAKYFTLFGRSY
ncbi:glutamate proline--tRNA ligase-like [Octopus vulgaris]|uniref:Bifunctional glutamate/proline--tRNA ligase n=1 Tax=Octopus vulgaris TaxID=6645 RepID=A0AA36F8N7_OCTVU|nr:glutamate proline--tRNA ligase-like [Octopus vulgaris]